MTKFRLSFPGFAEIRSAGKGEQHNLFAAHRADIVVQAHHLYARNPLHATEPADVRILSPICTHLGCPVAWSATTSQFRCPCHGGTFKKDGTLVSGPPPRGMDSLESQIRDGHLWVRWQDFRISVSERVAVQV